ncbi:MAG TPA: DUF2807 domain-containing protein, partial [Flavisolibacter sp.]|nr:DUF2807 domain-containing protein [Flavisolibacter sp.]
MRTIILGITLAIAFASCKKENKECSSPTTKEFNLTGFTRITAGENYSVQVKQGAAFGIKAKGCANDIDDLSVSLQAGNTLAFAYTHYESNRHRVDLEITLPSLYSIVFSGAAVGEVNGFGAQTTAMRTVVSGAAKGTVNQVPALVRADVSGTGVLNLSGTAPDLIATLSGDARLN